MFFELWHHHGLGGIKKLSREGKIDIHCDAIQELVETHLQWEYSEYQRWRRAYKLVSGIEGFAQAPLPLPEEILGVERRIKTLPTTREGWDKAIAWLSTQRPSFAAPSQSEASSVPSGPTPPSMPAMGADAKPSEASGDERYALLEAHNEMLQGLVSDLRLVVRKLLTHPMDKEQARELMDLVKGSR